MHLATVMKAVLESRTVTGEEDLSNQERRQAHPELITAGSRTLGILLLVGLLLAATGCRQPATRPGSFEQLPRAGAQNSDSARPAVPSPRKPGTPADTLKQAADKPSAPFDGGDWQPLFDGTTLVGWRETEFAGRAEVQCESGLIVLNMGDPFTGINCTNEVPRMNYEVALDAMRLMGSDFFCGLTVPVGDTFCSLIVGGWGGSLVGISSFDGMDASENETTKFINFDQNRWYRIRLRVTEKRIEAWIDQEKVIDVDTTGKKISLRPGDIELSKPFGLAAWQTTAALRQIKLRPVAGPASPGK